MARKGCRQFGEQGWASYLGCKVVVDQVLVNGENVDRLVARVHRSKELEKDAMRRDEEVIRCKNFKGLMKHKIGMKEQRTEHSPLRLRAVEQGGEGDIGGRPFDGGFFLRHGARIAERIGYREEISFSEEDADALA